jgi:methylenetetrahydrofolate reductase (NADPH)
MGSHPTEQTLEHDLPYLVEKVQAGADFIMTQLFFDVKAYDKFETTLRDHPSGAFKDIPIIPGLMPIQSYQILKRTTKLSHAKLPEEIESRLDAVKGDDEMVKKVGVDILSELVDSVKEIKSRTPGPKGFHFYTLNLEKAVAFILERTNLIPSSSPDSLDNSVIIEIDEPITIQINGPNKHLKPARRQSSVNSDPRNRVIVELATNPDVEATAAEAGVPKPIVNSRANTLAISEGEGSLGREATWDDYPNGRWGDARSPAYGEIDGYGVSLHMSHNQATKLWGYPETPSDITALFVRALEGTLSALPWSEQGLNEETITIRKQLLALNSKGWWTVASQPAVNGIRSTDPIFGWGPRNGFVFQKAFVELFLPSEDYIKMRNRLLPDEDISFLAMNAAGNFESSDAQSGTNAVTWGK